MVREYQSEVRDSVIRRLLLKVKEQDFGVYMSRIRLQKVRAFSGQQVVFDFPVTALIGTNGGGKSTVLGAAAIAYKSIKPALFFPKSSLGDESMANWSIGYEIIDKTKSTTQSIQRSARFRNSKWARDDLLERPILYFGIQRTVPAGERRDFKKFASAKYIYSGQRLHLNETVQEQVARILGKDVSQFRRADITSSQRLYVGGDGFISYSEFHFGAGESSVIRMVSEIEAAPKNALVLIEEIENGLHPVATRRMVEYLIDVADRRSIQSIFTTHSEDALAPLPPEAIWSSIDGKARQGRVSIEALRAITGRVDEQLAIFVEDIFAKEWVEGVIRILAPDLLEEIGVYALSGDGQAVSVHNGHRQNPSLTTLSVCILDGDSEKPEDLAEGIFKLPGGQPESEVFNYTRSNIDTLSMKLAVSLHLPPSKEERVKQVITDVSRTNRDPHVIFNQIGQLLSFIPTAIVSSALISLWTDGNPDEAKKIADFVKGSVQRARTKGAAE